MLALLGLAAGFKARAQTPFTFTLPPPSGTTSFQTSAGVYTLSVTGSNGIVTPGKLVQTLWRNRNLSAPYTYTASWNNTNDFGVVEPSGTYQIKVLYDNVQYTWDGLIGNTSGTFSGTTAHYNFEPMSAMTISGSNAYYCAGYDESHFDFTKFNTAQPQMTTDHFSRYLWSTSGSNYQVYQFAADIYDRAWGWAASDGTNVYFASPNCTDTGTNATNPDGGKPGFVVKYNIAGDTAAPFAAPYGQDLPSGPVSIGWGEGHQYRPFDMVLPVGTQPGVNGMAVQYQTNANGSSGILAVSVAPDNLVYLFDKATGAPLTTPASISVANPQGLAFAPNGDLWVISGTTISGTTMQIISGTLVTGTMISGTVLSRYAFTAPSGTSASTNDGSISGIIASSITGLTAPMAVAVNPTNNDIVLVADGLTSQQVKGFTRTGAVATGWSTPLGQAGGYLANGVAVASNKFAFVLPDDGSLDYAGHGAFLAFAPDGSFWVGDYGNFRAEHFSAAQAYIEQIMYRPTEYVVSTDLNNPVNVYANWIQYQVTYAAPGSPGIQTLTPGDPTVSGGNNCWQFVKNWTASARAMNPPGTNLYTGTGWCGLQTVVTLNNGRTWAMVNRVDGKREIIELQSGGLHPTGIVFDGSASLYANGEIRDCTVSGSIATITRQIVTFNGAGDPTWGSPITLASTPYGLSGTVSNPPPWTSGTFETNLSGSSEPYGPPFNTYYPIHRASYVGDNGPRFPSTSTGVIATLDSSTIPNANYGMHLGGVLLSGTQFLWNASPAITTGGANANDLGPDGLGSYSVDADSLGHWAGTTAWTVGQNIMYNYNGQWANYMNQFMHYWDDGLFIGQFGVSGGPASDYPQAGPNGAPIGTLPGLASNAFSPVMVQVGNSIYVYQTDEMEHSATHRWRIDGANEVAELVGTGTMNSGSSIPLNTQTTTCLSANFATTTIGSFILVSSSGSAQSPSSLPPDYSLNVGLISGSTTSAYQYTLGGLAAGDTVNISCNANNDNTTGDARGTDITVLTYLSSGSFSRQLDTTTTALHTWQYLSVPFMLQPNETKFSVNFHNGFSQPKGYIDNINISVTTP
ncbi:MAG: hypothetical protein WCD79_14740 [Chthoniobacteraceae bacterium]